MAQDPRSFNQRNLGNNVDKTEFKVQKVNQGLGKKTFEIPRDVGAANRPGRK